MMRRHRSRTSSIGSRGAMVQIFDVRSDAEYYSERVRAKTWRRDSGRHPPRLDREPGCFGRVQIT